MPFGDLQSGPKELGKVEDTAHASGDVGIMMLGVRNDAGTTFGADGDYVPFSMDGSNSLRVVIMGGDVNVANDLSVVNLVGIYQEDTASAGGDVGMNIMTVRSDTIGSTTSNNGDFQPLKSDTEGALYTAAVFRKLEVTDVLTTASDSVTATLSAKFSTAMISVQGSYTGATVSIQITTADGNKAFVPLLRLDQTAEDDGTSIALTNNSSNAWLVPVAAMDTIEISCLAISTGTIDVSIEASSAPFSYKLGERANSATLSNVSSSASNVTLLAANKKRKGGTIFNDSTSVLYAKFGATASATSFTYYLVPGAHLEIPFEYTGIIDGIWVSANGAARVTEFT